jgi:succinate dehydrogenase / fumarate reductase flavoprotein subunit
MQRNFGGQKKKRTAYAKSSTGKMIMTALIDETRRLEEKGRIERFCSHEFVRLLPDTQHRVKGVVVRNTYTGEFITSFGPVILAYGGLNGFFQERTTGTTANSGEAAAIVFSQGVVFSNLEMIQYHPTTIKIPGKRCLISEAARGEGGRLFVMRDGRPWYFMEEKYPEFGNLMPRDVVSREMYFVMHEKSLGGQVYLDMREIPQETWKKKLPDLRAEIMDYQGIDPAKVPVPVEPGIHYFMGGIDVDAAHRTSMAGLYAAGECCSLYHGANRLGGNSLLGAIYGGQTAALSLYGDFAKKEYKTDEFAPEMSGETYVSETPALILEISEILYGALGIIRNETEMKRALEEIDGLAEKNHGNPANLRRLNLARMMLCCAIYRKESRGAHYRSDYPDRNEKFQGYVKCDCRGIFSKDALE